MLERVSAYHASGRSPRVRGSPHPSYRRSPSRGSIPACAGEPEILRGALKLERVDPRVCGGARSRERSRPRMTGRSPRVRGSPESRRRSAPRRGSIPACAGEPCWSVSERVMPWVDPRVCGGANSPSCATVQVRGRSPRVRGSPAEPRRAALRLGSIPACAGEPCPTARTTTRTRVDPRVCGGAPRHGNKKQNLWGRSPRVRGSRALIDADEARDGSIPACAGEPRCGSRASPRPWVDPRVCGGAAR